MSSEISNSSCVYLCQLQKPRYRESHTYRNNLNNALRKDDFSGGEFTQDTKQTLQQANPGS